MGKRILVILGHPSSNSFCAAIAERYTQSALRAGHEVRQLSLGKIDFDPILREGYQQIQPLEADLRQAQADILWAEHLTLVYPIWWGGIPALLKGFFDRVFLPGFAFKYREGKAFPDKLLHGRSAHLLVTMDTPPWYYRWIYKMPGHNQMKITILEWCGIKPIKISSFGPLRGSSPEQREKWRQTVIKHAGKA